MIFLNLLNYKNGGLQRNGPSNPISLISLESEPHSKILTNLVEKSNNNTGSQFVRPTILTLQKCPGEHSFMIPNSDYSDWFNYRGNTKLTHCRTAYRPFYLLAGTAVLLLSGVIVTVLNKHSVTLISIGKSARSVKPDQLSAYVESAEKDIKNLEVSFVNFCSE